MTRAFLPHRDRLFPLAAALAALAVFPGALSLLLLRPAHAQGAAAPPEITGSRTFEVAEGATAGHFTLRSDGPLAFGAPKDFEEPDDADGQRPITFALLAGRPCEAGGICAADGTPLTEVPPALSIAARECRP